MAVSDGVGLYGSYICECCNGQGNGLRWLCGDCREDFCFSCKARPPEAYDESEAGIEAEHVTKVRP